jgi:hypothetical protein
MDKTLYQKLMCLNDTRFSEGREDAEDERPGLSVTMKTYENVEKVRALVRIDRCLGIRIIAEELNTDKQTARQILTNLNMKNLCVKIVPKNPPVLSSNTLRTHQILHRVTFPFLKIENLLKGTIFSHLKTSIRKRQSYLKHFHRITSRGSSVV